MRSVVTGGAGFLGSHLCDALLQRGDEVICLDNLITGATDNVAHLLGNRKFRFVHHDVTEYIFIDGPVDNVLHFASPASPIDYLKLPIQTLKVGSLGTHKALGLAKAKGRAVPAGEHLRGLRRPAGPSAAGDVLGPRQPDRLSRRV